MMDRITLLKKNVDVQPTVYRDSPISPRHKIIFSQKFILQNELVSLQQHTGEGKEQVVCVSNVSTEPSQMSLAGDLLDHLYPQQTTRTHTQLFCIP